MTRLPSTGLTVETIQTMRTVARMFRLVCERHFGMRKADGVHRSHDLASEDITVDYTVDLAKALRTAFATDFDFESLTTLRANFDVLGVQGSIRITACQRPGQRAVWAGLHMGGLPPCVPGS